MKSFFIYVFLGLLPLAAVTQDSTRYIKKWELGGYLKEMGTGTFDKYFDELVTGNLVHNRLNIKWKPDSQFIMALEARNRLFWGDEIRSTPGFTNRLKNSHERINASVVWISRNNFVLHSNIERLWADWRRSKWHVRVGRQRINWGITNVWNPNDIFNAYNFLDFDYEERPGTDAAKIQYLFNDASTLELAVSPSGRNNKTITAARYFISKRGYDLQIISGIYENKFTFGFGWSGSLGTIGYKGEGQAYIYNKDSGNIFNYSIQIQYDFKKRWFLSGSILHNTRGISNQVNEWAKLNYQLSPLQLMPARWSFILTSAKEFNMALKATLNTVYSPQVNMLIVYPSLNYKPAHNFDIDLVWQSYFLEIQESFQPASHQAFVRLKWQY